MNSVAYIHMLLLISILPRQQSWRHYRYFRWLPRRFSCFLMVQLVPDGLRPQHLKDLLLGAPDDPPLLLATCDLVNLQPAAWGSHSIISSKYVIPCNSSCYKQEDRRRMSYWCWLRLTTTHCQGCMLPCEGSQGSSFGAKSARFCDSWRGGGGSSCRQKIHRQHVAGTGVREDRYQERV